MIPGILLALDLVQIRYPSLLCTGISIRYWQGLQYFGENP